MRNILLFPEISLEINTYIHLYIYENKLITQQWNQFTYYRKVAMFFIALEDYFENSLFPFHLELNLSNFTSTLSYLYQPLLKYWTCWPFTILIHFRFHNDINGLYDFSFSQFVENTNLQKQATVMIFEPIFDNIN